MSKKSLVQKLKDRYNLRAKERIEREDRERPLKDRIRAIFSAPRFITTDFWCDTCKLDCTGTGYRQVCTVREDAPTAWFMGYCPKGHKMIRRITDKDSDPYFFKSRMVQRQRYELADALLTPDDPRFKLLYPEKWEELQQPKKEKDEDKVK